MNHILTARVKKGCMQEFLTILADDFSHCVFNLEIKIDSSVVIKADKALIDIMAEMFEFDCTCFHKITVECV